MYALGLAEPVSAPVAETRATSDVTVPLSQDWTVNWAWQDDLSGGMPFRMPDGTAQSYATLYARQTWVQVAVNKLAKGLGRLPIHVYAGLADDRQRDRTSPLAQLMAKPNGRMTPTTWKNLIASHLYVYGNAIIIKVGVRKATDVPVALRPVRPIDWSIAADGTYRWRAGFSDEKVYEPHQIIHLYFGQPGEDGFGISPLECLRRTLSIEYAAKQMTEALYANGLRPSGGLSTDQALKPEAIAALAADIRRMYAGAANAGKPIVLPAGLKWTSFAQTMDDGAVAEHRALGQIEVAAAFDVPPPMIGLLEHATFSNIEQQHLMFYSDTLGPPVTLFEEALNLQLISGVPAFAGRFVEFNMDEALRGDFTSRTEGIARLVNSGVLTPNEARKLLGNYRPIDTPDANDILLPTNLRPASRVVEEGS